ncbi:MAG: O-antigen ligase domain-containing protein [Clostridiales bacterium]|nr:O-antigen ligase domain-containing protein [Clostridiales bacterium]
MQKAGTTEQAKPWERPGVLLGGCLLACLLLVLAQTVGNGFLLLLVLIGCLLLAVLACRQGLAIPVLLFFLPWSPLMKLAPGRISFYTIGLLICCALALAQDGMRLTVRQVVLAASLMALTLTAKILQTGSITNDYLMFVFMLLLFPCVARSCPRATSFRCATMFFAGGIFSAAILARLGAHYPNISRYIIVESYLTVTRLSGFYGDPNFYSAHVTACLAGVLVLLSRETEKRRQILLAAVSVALLYCGLLSASKTFVLTVACLFLFWLPILLERGNYGSARTRLLFGVLCAVAFVLVSPAFRQVLQIIGARFTEGEGLAGLTTNRTTLWLQYLTAFVHDIPLTLFGAGYTSVNLFRKASHNTLIQAVYQFGILGIPLLLVWMWNMLADMFPESDKPLAGWKYTVLLCVGSFLPWMALDILQYDEFFLLPVYVLLGVAHVAGWDTPAESAESHENAD